MFSNISWQQYSILLVVLLVIYYGYVLLVYFRKDILQVAQKRNEEPGIDTKEIFHEEEENAVLFSTVHELMEELKETFETASLKKYPKEELLQALQLKLKKYKKLKGTAFQASINNFITTQGEWVCSIQIEGNELKNIW